MEDLTPHEYRALAELRYQIRLFLRGSEDAARSLGLEPSQHQLLLAALAGGDPDVGTIAQRLQLKHHSVVGLIDRLEQRGLVARRRAEGDRRRVRVSITSAGAEVLRQLAEQHHKELFTAGPRLLAALRDLLDGPNTGA